MIASREGANRGAIRIADLVEASESAQRAPARPPAPQQPADDDDDEIYLDEEMPPTAQSPPKRKSRVLRRKTDHSVIERRRREKINERLIRLQEMVPACREEALELLDKKPPKTARGPKVSAETKQKEILKHLSEAMVLEKLCIISHSVDYINELRATVAAYQAMCLCNPPVARSEPRDHSQHVKFAHDLEGSAESPQEPRRDSLSSRSPTSPDVPSATPEQDIHSISLPGSVTVPSSAPKRKRHWGSNRPIKAVPAHSHSSAGTSQSLGKRAKSDPSSAHEPSRRLSLDGAIASGASPSTAVRAAMEESDDDGFSVQDAGEGEEQADEEEEEEEEGEDADNDACRTPSDEGATVPTVLQSRQRRSSDPHSDASADYLSMDTVHVRAPSFLYRAHPHQQLQHGRPTVALMPTISVRRSLDKGQLPLGLSQQALFNSGPPGAHHLDRSRHPHKIASILSLDSARDVGLDPRRRLDLQSGRRDNRTFEAGREGDDLRPGGVTPAESRPPAALGNDSLSILAKVSAGTARNPPPPTVA